MKILLVHNFYKSVFPSGENMVYRAEKEMLEQYGKKKVNDLQVISYEKYNDQIEKIPLRSKLALAYKVTWSRNTYRDISSIIKKEKPDVVHFHNIFYLISPSAYSACKDAGVPVVQTFHNFRFFCVNGLLMRNQLVCEKCVGTFPWRGIVYGCHADSRLISLPIGVMGIFHRMAKTLNTKVDAYITLTNFAKKKFAECGVPEEKIFIKPNFYNNPPNPNFAHEKYILFIGRISEEKGVESLIDAFQMIRTRENKDVILKIVGSGDSLKQIKQKVKNNDIKNIEILGKKPFSECIDILKNALFLVVPSICYEGFPMVIREAFACGKPIVAARLGSMGELVHDGQTGLLFEMNNPYDLAAKMHRILQDISICDKMGKNARSVFQQKYTAEENFKMLHDIYKSVLNRNDINISKPDKVF